MQIFVSWSGERSKLLAAALRDWLRKLIQSVEPWMSDKDIESGARWSDAIAGNLKEARIGIICLTSENRERPWINFEAGAISNAITDPFVCPYLLGFEPAELTGPLAQFQARKADRQGTFRLVSTINSHPEIASPIPDQELHEAFELWWPKLENQLATIPKASPQPPPPRPIDDRVTEILGIVRELARATEHQRSSPSPMLKPDAEVGSPSKPSLLKILLENQVVLPGAVPRNILQIVERKAPDRLTREFPTRDYLELATSYVLNDRTEEGMKAVAALLGCTPIAAKGILEQIRIVLTKSGITVPSSS